MQRIDFHAMGCQMLAAVASDEPHVAKRLAEVPGWFETWEDRLSRFRPGSELSGLNRNAGSLVRVSPVLQEVIQAAVEAAEQSGGLVTPTILEALEAAGYDRSFESMAGGRTSGPMETLPPPADWRALEWDAEAQSVRLPIGVRLDLGGVAKGWAADRAAKRLKKLGPALVDAGGDITVSGPQADGQPWPIGVANPMKPDEPLELLKIAQGGVATSGRDYRRWQQDRSWQHHIIDPRSAHPAETDILAATVVARSAQEAEVAAKVMMILGSRDGLPWLDERRSLAAMIVLENGQVIHSRRMKSYVWS